MAGTAAEAPEQAVVAGDATREYRRRAAAPGGAAQRQLFEERLRRLGVASLALGLFTEPGKVSDTCQALAAYEPSGRAGSDPHFASRDFAPPGIFSNERNALLVQPLLFESDPIGILTFVLGHHHGSVYEQMRETFALALRGFRLAWLTSARTSSSLRIECQPARPTERAICARSLQLWLRSEVAVIDQELRLDSI